MKIGFPPMSILSCRLLPLIARSLLVLALAPSLVQGAAVQETMAEAMANVIARMMESTGFASTGVPNPVMSGWPSAFGNLPLPGGSGTMPWNNSVLEGIWEDNQGGLLIVQGRFYRLYAPGRGVIDGEIRVATNRVELDNRQENFTQTFEFALDQGRLALRNQSGQVFLYRRLELGRR
mgnify:CR=1 FL=1